MQKITILAILLSVIVITITAEMLSQDYIQTVRPDIEQTIQSNVLKVASFTDYIRQQEILDTAQIAQELLDDSSPNSPQSPDLNRNQVTILKSVRLETLITALNVPSLNFQFETPPDRVFGSFDLQSNAIARVVYGVINSDNTAIASIREITSNDQQRSLQVYQELKAIASSVPTFTINETNEFGDNSFYINPNQDSDSAFLINQKDNLIYAVAYQKRFHDSFKQWFELLL